VPADVEPLSSGGWRIATQFAGPPKAAENFYAVYEGSTFGHAERGIIAVMAAAETPAKGAAEAAQLVVHSFAEGFFGAQRTFSPRRAATLALNAINAWLYAQIRDDAEQKFSPVSFSAVAFNGEKFGIAHVGACRLYRSRGGAITPLNRPHLRTLPDGHAETTRAIGLDLELAVDYAEGRAEAGDIFLLISGMVSETMESVQAAFAFDLPAGNGPAASAILLEILAAPAPGTETRSALADLPLRPEPRLGDVWDGFEIGRTIYRGRYTVLKYARDKVENREVVLKIPLPTMLQDEVFAAGFMREAWIGATVRGGNVARYIELPPERRSSLYLVMPFYRGETLEARLNRPPVVSLPEGAGIALKLCEAVQDLAAIQIVHRDIKPDNIMLLANNGVKLLDLGLAYLPGIDLQDVVKPGGTLRYMAPELLNGVQAGPRSEVYALGVTIYRMFCAGAYPFGQREAVPFARLRPDLPSWFGRILQTALEPDPAARFADAGELAAALHEGLVTGKQDFAPPRRWKLNQLRIYQLLTALFAAGFLILLARALR
jgi:serine/threonine protein phosphatase PrpC